MKYNNGIPPDSRFNELSDMFKNTVESFEKEEGKTKFTKIDKLAKIAEG